MNMRLVNILAVCSSVLLVASCANGASDGEDEADSSAGAVDTDGNTSTEDAGSGVYGPEIKTPYVPNCPHHEAVSEVPRDEMFDRALELGCEYSIHGDISFDEPLQVDNGEDLMGITDPEYALTVDEMHEEGYIEDEEYEKFVESLEG